MAFVLHERLAADTVAVADWPLCRVLLMNDAAYPWLILVPARPDVREIHELERGDRIRLIDETSAAARSPCCSCLSEFLSPEILYLEFLLRKLL